MEAHQPVVAWAQDKLRLYLKIEIKPESNTGKAEFQKLSVSIEERLLRVQYSVDNVKYELSQKLLRQIDISRSKHTVVGRKLSIELYKRRPSGWKRPFVGLADKAPKWLKTDFDRWDEDLVASASSDDESAAAAAASADGSNPAAAVKAAAKAGAEKKSADLRAALQEVEESEKRAREERQRQLEDSLRKGVKPPPRVEVQQNVDLDGID